jgi:hypothetical protein
MAHHTCRNAASSGEYMGDVTYMAMVMYVAGKYRVDISLQAQSRVS